MNKELKLLLVAIGLILISIIVFWYEHQGCHQIEYQDLSGSHFVNVCDEGK